MQKLFFGMIITDPEHRRLRLKWRDYHSIIIQQTPYKSHNAKRGWFVLTSSCFRHIINGFALAMLASVNIWYHWRAVARKILPHNLIFPPFLDKICQLCFTWIAFLDECPAIEYSFYWSLIKLRFQICLILYVVYVFSLLSYIFITRQYIIPP